MGAGHYVAAVHPVDMNERTEDDLARGIIGDVVVGVDGTGIKAGIIGEIGCTWSLAPNERKSLTAGAIAQQETDAAILIHPGRHPDAPAEILEVLANGGADLSRVIMGSPTVPGSGVNITRQRGVSLDASTRSSPSGTSMSISSNSKLKAAFTSVGQTTTAVALFSRPTRRSSSRSARVIFTRRWQPGMAHLTGTLLGISPILQQQLKEGVSGMRAEWSASATFARKVIRPSRMIAESGRLSQSVRVEG